MPLQPDNKFSIAPARLEQLGLEVLAACLPGHEVQILDLRIVSIREPDRQLAVFKPGVVGLTVNNTINVIAARTVLDHIRTGYPQVTLIVGGHHPTRMPVREFYKFLLLLIAFFLIFKVKRHVKMVGLEPDLA